jgi:glycogen debranching enzyme
MLARLGEHDIARRCLRSLFAMQEANGFVGHMIYWHRPFPVHLSNLVESRPSVRAMAPHMSALMHPPIAALALLALLEESGDLAFVREMLPALARHHDWLASRRDFDGDGLLSIISTFESGMDYKPSYDIVLGHEPRTTATRLRWSSLYWKVMAVELSNFVAGYDLPRIRRRGLFIVKDAGLNALYALDLQAMERLAEATGGDASAYAARRARVARSLLDVCYDHELDAFLDVQEPGGRRLPVLTPTILFPLAVDLVPQPVAEAVVRRHFVPNGPFDVPWPMPTVDVRDSAFRRGATPFLWRGPVWALVNWVLARAFAARGMRVLAAGMRESLAGLVEASGLREYYDPVDGRGLGAHDFTWSGLLVDLP